MREFTESDIRGCFVNASKGEAKRASLPDLSSVDWAEREVFGWVDAKRDQVAYAVIDVDGEPRGVLLRRAQAPAKRRRLMCSWCQDIVENGNVSMFVAPRAGASGRAGNTIGTSICSDFSCSAHVRRMPTAMEMPNPDDRAWWIQGRIDELQRRSRHFLDAVITGDQPA